MMRGVTGFLKRHFLALGFITALGPILVLLGLQYTWLSRWQKLSEATQRTALQNYVEGVGTKVEYFYRGTAERLLNLPAAAFRDQTLGAASAFWQPRDSEGVRRLFVVDFSRSRTGEVHVFDSASRETAPTLGEALAIGMAASPWAAAGGALPRTSGLCVDERDPRFRMILNPITGDSARVVGLAGMILDEAFFRERLLPQAIQEALPDYFPDEARNDLAVSVCDARGQPIIGAPAAEGSRSPLRRNFPFVFTDWSMNLQTGAASPQHWAQATRGSNMAIALLVALLLLGGITWALRSAERAMRLSEMKSDFVSNVSHELRTPVASIRMFADFLRLGRARTPEKVQEYGEHIEAESRRLAELIDNILDFARIESGRRMYRMEPTDVVALVQASADLFAVRLKDSGFALRLELPETPPPPLALDADAMAQAIQNLIDNAVKYSGAAREVTVRVASVPGEVMIAVRDQGIGIPPREQRKIFERFHRAGSSLVHDVKGSGLGLAIVHHVVLAHQGRVTVQSSPGSGSTFVIHLPALAATEAPAPTAQEAALRPGRAARPKAS